MNGYGRPENLGGDENENLAIEKDARWEAQITGFSSQHGRDASRLERTKEKIFRAFWKPFSRDSSTKITATEP